MLFGLIVLCHVYNYIDYHHQPCALWCTRECKCILPGQDVGPAGIEESTFFNEKVNHRDGIKMIYL